MTKDAGTARRPRTGATALSLLAKPLCTQVLRAHLEGPLRVPDLCQRIKGATETALRGQVVKLREIGALARRVRARMPYTVENELTEAGFGILAVANLVAGWLVDAPLGPIAADSEEAKTAIKALVGGWDSTILHALAMRPLSLTELSGALEEISYPSIERRLLAMRAVRQIEAKPVGGGSKRYAIAEWTQQSAVPLVAASRWERSYLPTRTDEPGRVDVETVLLLALPLVALRSGDQGLCLLAVADDSDLAGADGQGAATGICVEIEAGTVASCAPGVDVEEEARSRALGDADSWFEAIVDGNPGHLRIDGEEPQLVEALIEGLNLVLRRSAEDVFADAAHAE